MKSQFLIAAAAAAFVVASPYAQTPAGTATNSAVSATPPTTRSGDAGASNADNKAIKKQAEADYSAVKEGCHAKKGPDRKWCLREAEAAHDKAEADARGKR